MTSKSIAAAFLIKPSNSIGEHHLVQRFQTMLRATPYGSPPCVGC